jgi:hypothetical protein
LIRSGYLCRPHRVLRQSGAVGGILFSRDLAEAAQAYIPLPTEPEVRVWVIPGDQMACLLEMEVEERVWHAVWESEDMLTRMGSGLQERVRASSQYI